MAPSSHITNTDWSIRMTTTYLTQQAKDIAAHIEELKDRTATINRDTIRMKARAIEIADLKEQELAVLDEFNNASKEWDTAKQKLNSILA